MSKYNSLGELFTAIANAIRAKTGGTDPIVAEDFPEVIDEMKSGGEIEALTVSENGTYTPPEGVDGYAPVTVNVVPPASDIDALINGSITEITSGATSIRPNSFRCAKTLSKISLPNAKNGYRDYSEGAFYDCTKLTDVFIPNLTRVDSSMFRGCTALEHISFPNVSSLGSHAFYGCTSLKEVHLHENVDFLYNTGGNAFQNCNALQSINMPKLTNLPSSCFMNCKSLVEGVFPLVTMIGSSCFQGCASLKKIDFHSDISSAGSYSAYSGCTNLTALIFRSESKMATCISTGILDSTPILSGTGYIYVPRALIEDYKAATNWVTFADQFRALEDYTVDGTTTGELDESKVSL